MRTWYRIRYDEALGAEVKKCSQCHVEKVISEFYKNGKAGYHGKCKECDLVAKKDRYNANPEKYRTQSREYAHKHPEERLARYNRWHSANEDRRLRYYREYNESHRLERRSYDRNRHSKETSEFRHMQYEKRREYFHHWGKINKERKAEANRIRRQKFPWKHAENQSRRRARKVNAPKIERIDRQAIIERDNWICHLCGITCTSINVTLDHVVPLFHGGSHTSDNLRVACRSCNCSKGSRLPHNFLK